MWRARLHSVARRPPAKKKTCFLKSDYQKLLVKWQLETQTSSQITTFEWKDKKNIRLFQRFCENHSSCNENEVFPMFASRWLPDAASGRLAKPKAKTKTRTKTKAETKIEAKSKTRLRLSLRLGLRQRLRLKLRIVSNWDTCLGSSPRIIKCFCGTSRQPKGRPRHLPADGGSWKGPGRDDSPRRPR